MQEDTSVWERDMYKRKIEKDIRCPLEYGLEVFGGKWNSRIICVLAAMKILVTVNCARRWGILQMQFWHQH